MAPQGGVSVLSVRRWRASLLLFRFAFLQNLDDEHDAQDENRTHEDDHGDGRADFIEVRDICIEHGDRTEKSDRESDRLYDALRSLVREEE